MVRAPVWVAVRAAGFAPGSARAAAVSGAVSGAVRAAEWVLAKVADCGPGLVRALVRAPVQMPARAPVQMTVRALAQVERLAGSRAGVRVAPVWEAEGMQEADR